MVTLSRFHARVKMGALRKREMSGWSIQLPMISMSSPLIANANCQDNFDPRNESLVKSLQVVQRCGVSDVHGLMLRIWSSVLISSKIISRWYWLANPIANGLPPVKIIYAIEGRTFRIYKALWLLRQVLRYKDVSLVVKICNFPCNILFLID